MNQLGVIDPLSSAASRRPGRRAPRAGSVARLHEVAAAALDSAPVGLLAVGQDGSVRLLTRAAAGLLGFADRGAWDGMPFEVLLAACRGLGAEPARRLAAGVREAGPEPRRIRLNLAGPNQRRVLSVDIRAAGSRGWVLSLEDMTHTAQTQDWLLEHVSSDPVTGLWNRQHFLLRLRDSLDRDESERPTLCVLLVGLSGLKHLTEAAGPEAGDTLLRMAADRLAALLGEDDMLASYSADEFVLALAGLPDRSRIAARCARVRAALSRPCVLDGHSVSLDAHVGAAIAGEDGHTAEELTLRACLALRAAESGGVAMRFFDPDLRERAQQRRALEADLRQALVRGEFELHYQPQVDVYRGCVAGLEALIRWRCPQRGLVPPAAFIGLAEEIGLIGEIGDWVLREACGEAMLWPEEVTVAVNASPLQFETGQFARSVAQALAITGLPARRLEIEVTENLLLRDTGTVLDTLAALKQLGVRLVLDDFGTGYASLSQLSRFRFDKIKIDRSFVSQQHLSEHNSAIVRSIAALGSSLGIPTTAEGVETATQLAQIKADGCTCVQGYFFSRPVPSGEVAAMMQRLHHP
jgi:diguanylate cyclase (GGDEF)-like protein